MQLIQASFAASALLAVSRAVSLGLGEPSAPSLSYLLTAMVECKPFVFTTQTPRGLRTTIPIIGGNFTGPRLKGNILDIGADWALIDPQTGILSADSRYNLQTDDGANILIQTSGPTQPDGSTHLRLMFETGDKKYYWLNNIVAVGILSVEELREDGSSLLKIHAWNIESAYNSTTFYNGTTY
ncbi:hypothetical protein B0J12DRAFT_673260 [Macrophomina phaseolina]|uniref:Uncharacterized protein n=1 Tax=Macrophomina phaseolina TaxID=35725 RepID=A0ABQ8G365_9PEZI|nr:hypothetical protein B0J12DRAFT_673260 [Macrophomina phaseolina]